MGLFTFYSDIFLQFGKSLFFSSTFLSNVFFNTQAGYFDTSSFEKPLLHTWSLSVEEQFYFIWPFMLWFFTRSVKEKGHRLIIGTLSLASYGAMVATYFYHEMSSFYLIYARFWQFMVGANFAFFSGELKSFRKPFLKNILTTFSLIILLATTMVFEESTPVFIYSLFTLPIILLILYGHDEGLISYKVLSNPVLVLVGKASYSIYLWHWFVVVMIKYSSVDFHYAHQLGAFLASLVLGILSWRFIETPFRKYSDNREVQAVSLKYFVAFNIGFALLGLFIIANDGLGFRFSLEKYITHKKTPVAFQGCHDSDHSSHIKLCEIGLESNSNVQALSVGDSHSFHYSLFSHKLLSELKMVGYQASAGSCFMGLETLTINRDNQKRHAEYDNCLIIKKKLAESIADKKTKLFIVSQRFAFYSHLTRKDYGPKYSLVTNERDIPTKDSIRSLFKKSMMDLVEKIVAQDKKLLIMGQVPLVGRTLKIACLKKSVRLKKSLCGMNKEEWQRHYEFSKSVLNELQQTFPKNVYVYFPDDTLCSNPGKKCSILLNDILLYRDEDHLNGLGAQVLFEQFDLQDFKNFMGL